MTDEFDKDFWDRHWAGGGGVVEVNPHLVSLVADLAPGTALDAGCGAGTEASWLSQRGWRVTGADISAEALASARARDASVEWIEADLTTWEPGQSFDLVTTFYAHASIPQLDLYERIARWVAPGGTLLIVGHLHDGHHPDEASVTASDVAARLHDGWRVDVAADRVREVAEHPTRLADAVVRATRV